MFKTTILISSMALVLVACGKPAENKASVASASQVQSSSTALQFNTLADNDFKVEAVQHLAVAAWPEAFVIQSSKNQGLRILDQQNKVLTQLEGKFGAVGYRVLDASQILVQVVDLKNQQAMTSTFNFKTNTWSKMTALPKTTFKIETLCLYENESKDIFSFLIGEQGQGEQWIIGQHGETVVAPKLVRQLNLPVGSSSCAVDQQKSKLLINEEGIGVWQYPADPEQPFTRQIVDLVQPYGQIQGTPAGMALLGKSAFVLDEKAHLLYQYEQKGKAWTYLKTWSLPDMKKPEQLQVWSEQGQVKFLVNDNHQLKMASLSEKEANIEPITTQVAITDVVTVQPEIQTVTVPHTGDAADDPAIWHNLKNPSQSRVLGTDKLGGLQVYDLQGKETQYLPVGRLNNVDVRSNFMWGNERVDVAIATNRDQNSLHVFAIDQSTGKVSVLGEVATSLKDIYGICLYQNRDKDIFAIPNDKDGTFVQYQITGKNKQLQGTEVKRFAVKTQPEGCVVDDLNDRIFLGEEDHAVWSMSLLANNDALQKVIAVGEHGVKDDIEGMGIYQGKNHSYLVFSSQGNDSYVVVDATAPYQYRGRFKVGMNLAKNIDAISETDGLEVSSFAMGGVWKQGMFVAQDGHKRMPEGNQNFKYVPWTSIAQALKLPE
ncbi:phytase [Acinetobacter rathckeae]|uniref:phytase n=1 Tax=Acinetobacter rathckeae TaxID=2605272 RepID=UPI0018A2FE31|nr:phytase [Acinetobacter rathckeae]MBF7688921.1 phytase [Acinetobacter rathckeae]MBF7696320.1 phytase [Acinetobacter rathckeae]